MFAVLDQICTGMTFTSPDGNNSHQSTGFGYVDDVTLGTTIEQNPNINNDNIKEYSEAEEKKVHEDISSMGQNWERMLHTNGGMLELRKCYWVFIVWKWVRGEAKMKKLKRRIGNLLLHSQRIIFLLLFPGRKLMTRRGCSECILQQMGNENKKSGDGKLRRQYLPRS